MAKKMYAFQGKDVPGEEIEFEIEREGFNVYLLEDGTKMKMKTVVSSIVRLEAYKPDGEPLYMINSANVATANVPERLKKKPE